MTMRRWKANRFWEKLACLLVFTIGLTATIAEGTAQNDASERVDRLTVAAVQYRIEGNCSIDEIVDKVETLVKEAVAEGADCVVFPELITLDAWRLGEADSEAESAAGESAQLKRIAVEITPDYLKRVAALAATYKIDILAGSTPRFDGDKLFNTAYFFCRDGREFSQDKLYPTTWELGVGVSPGTELTTFNAAWGKGAMLICYDVEFPDVSTLLAEEAPLLIFVPSMTESVSGLQRVQWCAQARAVEHHAIVVISGTVGKPSQDWEHFGQASIIAPRDKDFAALPSMGKRDEPMLITELVDLTLLRQSRQTTSFHPASRLLERSGDAAIRLSSRKPK